MKENKTQQLKYKIGDEFYITIQEENDCEYYAIYKGIVIAYSCGVVLENGEFEIQFYKTLILNCPQLHRYIQDSLLTGYSPGNSPYNRLEELGIHGKFITEIQSLELDINTSNEKYMRSNVIAATFEATTLYDLQGDK